MAMTKELWNKLVISKIVSKVGQAWKGTENINLTEFYANTRPKFVMAHCMLEHIDCRRLWTVRSKPQFWFLQELLKHTIGQIGNIQL